MSKYNSDLQEKLQRLNWLAQHYIQKSFKNRGPRADATRGQGRVLAALKMQPEITTKDLAYLLGIRTQSLNELISKLEKNGFVTREQSEADKRVVIVKITEKGQGEEQQTTEISDIFNCLNPAEQQTFGEYLDRLIAALEEEVGGIDEDEYEWMLAARERLGDSFDQLVSMRRGGRPGRRGGPRGGGFSDPRFGGFGGIEDPRIALLREGQDPRFGDPRFGGGFPGRPKRRSKKDKGFED